MSQQWNYGRGLLAVLVGAALYVPFAYWANYLFRRDAVFFALVYLFMAPAIFWLVGRK